MDKQGLVLVGGGGGFIGGHLVGRLLEDGFKHVRAVDIKPVDEWYQVFPGVDNRCLDRDESQDYHAWERSSEGFAWRRPPVL